MSSLSCKEIIHEDVPGTMGLRADQVYWKDLDQIGD